MLDDLKAEQARPSTRAEANCAAGLGHVATEPNDRAVDVEETQALRDELMSVDYATFVKAAVKAAGTLLFPFPYDLAAGLEAIRALREEIPGATPDGSVSVSAAWLRLQALRQAR